MVKKLPAMQETWVQSLGWEDPLEQGMATHSSILAWRIPMDRGARWAAVLGVAELDTTEQLNIAYILLINEACITFSIIFRLSSSFSSINQLITF